MCQVLNEALGDRFIDHREDNGHRTGCLPQSLESRLVPLLVIPRWQHLSFQYRRCPNDSRSELATDRPPSFSRPCLKGLALRVTLNTPVLRTRPDCCARAASGHAVSELPIPLTNSRRCIASPQRLRTSPTMTRNETITARICDLRNGV
jgi:hypothetical protein